MTSPIHHNATAWKTHFEKSDFPKQRQARAEIYKQTKAAARHSFILDNKKVTLYDLKIKEMKEGTKIIHHPHEIKVQKAYDTAVKVYEGDTIDITKKLQKKGLHPAALNMANAHTPGGGVKGGARAQEESIFRRSNYFQSLYPKENKHLAQQLGSNPYYVPKAGVVYSPSVTVFRKNEGKGFAFCKPFQIDMIASAAYHLHSSKLPEGYEENTKAKMRAILRTAKGTGHDAVVLGAFGCGAFKNSPKKIATLFKQVIQEKEFKGAFKEIAFAIINDHNGKNNLKNPFSIPAFVCSVIKRIKKRRN